MFSQAGQTFLLDVCDGNCDLILTAAVLSDWTVESQLI
jgi:hypothetical protein